MANTVCQNGELSESQCFRDRRRLKILASGQRTIVLDPASVINRCCYYIQIEIACNRKTSCILWDLCPPSLLSTTLYSQSIDASLQVVRSRCLHLHFSSWLAVAHIACLVSCCCNNAYGSRCSQISSEDFKVCSLIDWITVCALLRCRLVQYRVLF